MVYTRSQKKQRRWLAVFAALLGAFILYGSTQPVGIPARSQLKTATGAVEWLGGDRYSTDFRLAGHARIYSYASKGNMVGLVESALENGRSQTITVLYGPAQAGGPFGDHEESYPVYEVRLGERVVRGYGEIKSAWESDNRVGVWVGVAMLVCSGLIAFTRLQ